MILRRVIQHFRNQEWTAIAIDFVIVVFGVFIGIQVSNWNATRQELARGADYTQRLKAELQAEFEYANALIAYNESTRDAARIAYEGIAGTADIDDKTILINAFRASQYNWYERHRAVFDEVVASGSLSLITDASIRLAAVGIYNTLTFSLAQSEGQISRYRELFRMAIELNLHDELGRNCGDKPYTTNGVAVGLLTLNYDCNIDASDVEMANGVAALRSDPDILRTLRLRNAQIVGRISDLETTLQSFGMYKMFSKDKAP
jgi:hypothetical protein